MGFSTIRGRRVPKPKKEMGGVERQQKTERKNTLSYGDSTKLLNLQFSTSNNLNMKTNLVFKPHQI